MLAQAGHIVNGRHLGGRRRPTAPHRSRLTLKGVNPSKLAQAPASTNRGAAIANILGTCWANGPSNASPPAKVTVGDCTEECSFHLLPLRQSAAGRTPYFASVNDVLTCYEKDGGYVYGDESTDQGCDEDTVLSNACSIGWPGGDKLTAFVDIDATQPALVRFACWRFVGLACCWEVPDACIQAVPAGVGPGWGAPVATWAAGTANPQNGHCFALPDLLDADSLSGDTWGVPVRVPLDAIGQLSTSAAGGSLSAMLDEDLLPAVIQDNPDGADWATFVSDWQAIGGALASGSMSAPSLIERIEAWLGRRL